MLRSRSLSPCALIALSTLLLASGDGKPAAPDGTGAAGEPGAPALFAWGDFDGDQRLDLVTVSDSGMLQLLAADGAERFEDVTERAGLSGIANAGFALWADYDGDRWLDLFVGAREGASRLFKNESGSFVDVSTASGLTIVGPVRSARWLDHDGDGRLDLHVVEADRSELFRGLEGGSFAAKELPPLPAAASLVRSTSRAIDPPLPGSSPAGEDDTPHGTKDRSQPGGVRRPMEEAPGPLVPGGVSTTVLEFPPACASTIRDQANPGSCLQASTLPMLGTLYPLSVSLFVSTGGDVGLGTTSPAAKLEVAGTARITDTLTLAPAGDAALDVSTGSIYKSGALFIHTKGGASNTALGSRALSSATTGLANTASGYEALLSNTAGTGNTANGYKALLSNTTGSNNTASGAQALQANTTGLRNTASGSGALRFNTTGFRNTADGFGALRANTTGFANTASGATALYSNTTGSSNTASGYRALEDNTTGYSNTAIGSAALIFNQSGVRNTAIGDGSLIYNNGSFNTAIGNHALDDNLTGSRNIAIGSLAGSNLTTGSNNIAIGNQGVVGESATIRIGTAGTHTRAFIAGIRGVTTGNADALPVLIDSAGQLGTVSSSRRFKKDIADMGEATERLLELRPVVFRYKEEQVLPEGGAVPLEYGLIAEEVAEVFPDLVVYDEEGQPFTVKYHLLSSMLLNELKRLDRAHARELEELRREFEGRLAALESRASSKRPAASSAGN